MAIYQDYELHYKYYAVTEIIIKIFSSVNNTLKGEKKYYLDVRHKKYHASIYLYLTIYIYT